MAESMTVKKEKRRTLPGPSSARTRKQVLISWGFVLPFMLVFFTFTVLPVLASMVLSLTNFNMLQTPDWVGLDNYVRLFLEDDVFQTAVKNTLFFALLTGPVGYILCFVFAWMINGFNPKLRAALTLLFYAPSMMGNMAVIWQIIFSGDQYGLLNSLLIQMGLVSEPIQWLTDTSTITAVVVVVVLWSSLGTSFLAFIAGLQNIDGSLLEAAAIDGVRNRWQELYFIILPGMKPQLMFGAVMSISGSFGIGAAITQLVGFPSTDYVVHTLVHHLEDYGSLRYQMGYASAIATLLFAIMILSNKLVQKIIARVGK